MGGKLGKQQSYVVSGGKRERVGEGRRDSVRSENVCQLIADTQA